VTTLGVTVLLTIVVGWLTAAATAVRSVSRIWLRHWAERQLSGSGTAALFLHRPHRLLLAAGTGIAATVFALGAMVGIRESGVEVLEHLLVAALSLLVAGQLLPRAISRRWATPLVPVLMPALRFLGWACTPLLAFAGVLVRPVTQKLATPPRGEHDSLEDLLREGELEGVGEARESAIISGVVEFGERLAHEVMTPRQDIVAVERSMPPGDIARIIIQAKYSRIPVYEHDLDHVVGMVHSFDVLAHPLSPVAALRKIAIAPADARCDELMRRMLRDRLHLAVIRGAAGETLGLVSLEDLVEELVGDIRDEHDEPSSAPAE
jgi:putative hemolysin